MTSTAIRFGTIETITIHGEATTIVSENIHDFTPTSQVRKTTVKVIADNRKKVLAELLKLADKLSEEDVSEIAFECVKRNSGSPYKMAVSWVSK